MTASEWSREPFGEIPDAKISQTCRTLSPLPSRFKQHPALLTSGSERPALFLELSDNGAVLQPEARSFGCRLGAGSPKDIALWSVVGSHP